MSVYFESFEETLPGENIDNKEDQRTKLTVRPLKRQTP